VPARRHCGGADGPETYCKLHGCLGRHGPEAKRAD
jgi:hypothetical protein